MTLQSVFRGLADNTRRDILKMLAKGDMSIAEVADRFDITRTAVKKHLQVLEEGDLISVRTEGRTRVSQLNPDALRRAEDWMQFFSAFWSDRLEALDAALKEHDEGKTFMTDCLTKSAFFAASRDVVWRFLTDKDLLGTWYHPAREDLTEGAAYELYDTDADGRTSRHVWGRVIRADPPKELICTFEVPVFDGDETTLTWTLEPLAGGTKLTLRHEGIGTASGEAASRLLAAIDKGWDEHFGALRHSVQKEAA